MGKGPRDPLVEGFSALLRSEAGRVLARSRSAVLRKLLQDVGVQPVLMDIGAVGGYPTIWNDIRACSTYIGIDPNLSEGPDGTAGFKSVVRIDKVITPDAGAKTTPFYFTRSRQCSSLLEPNGSVCEEYLRSEWFDVEKREEVPATTLDGILDGSGLDRVDWFKVDAQGADLRLFRSLSERRRGHVLAVDVECDLVNLYRGEDMFVDAHVALTQEGYWPSDLRVVGSVRIGRSTFEHLSRSNQQATADFIEHRLKHAPGWLGARYLKSVAALEAAGADRSTYVLLWVFAMMDDQLGYALDIARRYRSLFGEDTIGSVLWQEPQWQMAHWRRGLWMALGKALLPAGVKAGIKKVLLGKGKAR